MKKTIKALVVLALIASVMGCAGFAAIFDDTPSKVTITGLGAISNSSSGMLVILYNGESEAVGNTLSFAGKSEITFENIMNSKYSTLVWSASDFNYTVRFVTRNDDNTENVDIYILDGVKIGPGQNVSIDISQMSRTSAAPPPPPPQPAPQPAPPPRQEPPPPPARNPLTLDDVKPQKSPSSSDTYSFVVKALYGETVNPQGTPVGQISNYQVEVAPLGRISNEREAARADWKNMEAAFKDIKIPLYRRAFGSVDGYSFNVDSTVRANVYGQRGRPGSQPVIVRIRAKTSDSRSAQWGDWIYFLGDGKGY